MTIYVIVGHKGLEKIGPEITKYYSGQYYVLPPSTWFVSDKGTTSEVASKLGILDGKLGAQAVIFPTNTWAGWAPADLWEWLKSKREARPDG